MVWGVGWWLDSLWTWKNVPVSCSTAPQFMGGMGNSALSPPSSPQPPSVFHTQGGFGKPLIFLFSPHRPGCFQSSSAPLSP